jgi:hypothetical protein
MKSRQENELTLQRIREAILADGPCESRSEVAVRCEEA